MNIDYIMGDRRSKALILLGFILLNSVLVSAQSTAVETAISCMACRIMQLVFMIIGMVVTLVVIFAGLKWVGSGEDPDARNQAKSMIIHAIIGLVIIIIAAYAVSWLTGSLMEFQIADPATAVSGCNTAELCGYSAPSS